MSRLYFALQRFFLLCSDRECVLFHSLSFLNAAFIEHSFDCQQQKVAHKVDSGIFSNGSTFDGE